ncbi:FG-GAP-like repeat-containing protein [Maribacter sp. 2304DJ31-5]|uniref:FG-GAP-like repeat-containing protein n=1 Tax=Maribacter sp. 2304DJ31-5 TaxID=3386273 RepID=UPI0039BD8FB4
MKRLLLLLFFFIFSFHLSAQIDFESHVLSEYQWTLGEIQVSSADLDGDGHNDIISASFGDDKIAWFDNTNGAGNFGSQKIISESINGVSSVAVGDIDNDGDIDVVSASYDDNKVSWHDNDGTGNFTDENVITNIAQGARNIHLADVDDDGDIDVIVASENDNSVNWHENDGTGEFTSTHLVSDTVNRAYSVYASDIDLDGDLDIISAAFESGIVSWFENSNGLGTFSQEHLVGNYNSGVTFVAAEDLNGDGFPDIVVGMPRFVFWLKNKMNISGERHFPDLDYLKKEAGTTNINTNAIFIIDIDGDNDLDVVSVCDRGSYWYNNADGQGSFVCVENVGINCDKRNRIDGKADTVFPIDLDSDGDIDIIRGISGTSSGSFAKIYTHFNQDGNGNFGNRLFVNSEVEQIPEMIVEDLDNDGFKDIITISQNRVSIFIGEDGNGNFRPSRMILTSAIYPESLKLEDMDGDGDQDIVYISNYYSPTDTEGKISWIPNTDGMGNFGQEVVIATNRSHQNSIDVADVDLDGDLDILMANITSTELLWYENLSGNGQSWIEKPIATNTNIKGSVFAADFDSDGDSDILVCSYGITNHLTWYENLDGFGNYGLENIITENKGSTKKPSIADIDNDGDLDIVSSIDKNIFWFENIDGQGSFNTQHQVNSTLLQGGFIIESFDVDNDGDLDLVSSGARSLEEFPWFENTDGLGNYRNSQIIEIDPFTHGHTEILTNDIDADGNVDIICASNSRQNITWYKNLGLQKNEINGFVKLNSGQNGCISGNSPLKDVMIVKTDNVGTDATFTISNGFYQFFAETGEHTVSISSNFPDYYTIVPQSQTINFVGDGNTESIDYCLSANQVINDLNVTLLPTSEARPGFQASYSLVFKNIGTTELNGEVSLNYNSKLILESASSLPDSQSLGLLTFLFEDFKPFATQEIQLVFNIPPPPTVGINDFLHFTSTINPIAGDFTEKDNTHSFMQTVVGSYDPNDITVLEGEEVNIDNTTDYLNYVIRFQNTGTASAINVRIDHELDADLDWETFIPISSSHSNSISITDGKDVEFLFENINLPDSTSNEPASHGHIAFKIKPKSSVVVGDIVNGTASIYFDFNPPIITNTVSTEFILNTLPLNSNAFAINSISCIGANDGEIQVEATGGLQPYQYELLDENSTVLVSTQASNTFNGLVSGDYITKVIDNNGDESLFSITLEEPLPLNIVEGTVKEITCNGANDGEIEITVTGGTAPYNYSINGEAFQTSNLFTDLAPGLYSIEVSDSNRCNSIPFVFEVAQPEILTITATVTEITCKGMNDGKITVTASGGTQPYEYSLDGIAFSPDSEFNNLSPANYVSWVRDANGCVVSNQDVLSEPNSPDFDNDGLGDACDDDIDGDGILNAVDECPETQLGTLVDSNGCESFTLPNNNFTIQITSETCASSNNGSVLINAIENLDYTATLTNGGNLIENKDFRTFASFQNLMAGSYDVCITVSGQADFERCFSIEITEPEPLNVDSKISVSGKAVTLKMKGGSNYTIILNGETHITSKAEITLPLTLSENQLLVKTDKDCQGVFEEMFHTNVSNIMLYPNPVSEGELSILVPRDSNGKVHLTMFTNSGKMVLRNTIENTENPIKLDVSRLQLGIYNLKIETESNTDFHRIIIK